MAVLVPVLLREPFEPILHKACNRSSVIVQLPEAMYQDLNGNIHKLLKAGVLDQNQDFLYDHLEVLLIDLAITKDNLLDSLSGSQEYKGKFLF